MISLLLLLAWMVAGAAAVMVTDHGAERRQSLPLAVVFGPLWLTVTHDRRVVAPLVGDDPGR